MLQHEDVLDALGPTVDAVLDQSFVDLELLLVQDGALDGGASWLRELTARDARVRVLAGEGTGPCATWDRCVRALDEARGTLVTWVRPGVVLLADAVERQVAVFADTQVEVAIGSTQRWWTWDPDVERRDAVDHFGPDGFRSAPAAASEALRGDLRDVSLSAVMARTDVARAIVATSPAPAPEVADDALLLALLSHAAHVHRQVVARVREPAAGDRSGLASTDPATRRAAEQALAGFGLDHLRRRRETASSEGAEELERRLQRWLTQEGLSGTVPGSVRRQAARVGRRARREIATRSAAAAIRRLPSAPVSTRYGYDRGTPVDRVYIERFLDDHRRDVRGAVLEIGDATYTRRFGDDRVVTSDVLHIAEGDPNATIVADLSDAPHIPDGSFDCVVLAQTVHLVFDVAAVVDTVHRILRPSGVLLLTVPAMPPMTEQEGWAHYWSFTARSVERLLTARFEPSDVLVDVAGNVRTATAFLYGLAAEELDAEAFDQDDWRCPVTVTARARRR